MSDSKRVEFVHDGRRFLYDLDDDRCGMKRFMRAQAVWEFQQQIKSEPPDSFAKMEATGAVDSDLRALAYLLLELDEEGNVVGTLDADAVADALEFLESLPAKYAKELKDVKLHFFGRAGLYSLESLRLLGQLYGASMDGEASAAVLNSAAMSMINESASPTPSSGANDSTKKASSTASSRSATRKAPTTGTPSPSSPVKRRGKSKE